MGALAAAGADVVHQRDVFVGYDPAVLVDDSVDAYAENLVLQATVGCAAGRLVTGNCNLEMLLGLGRVLTGQIGAGIGSARQQTLVVLAAVQEDHVALKRVLVAEELRFGLLRAVEGRQLKGPDRLTRIGLHEPLREDHVTVYPRVDVVLRGVVRTGANNDLTVPVPAHLRLEAEGLEHLLGVDLVAALGPEHEGSPEGDLHPAGVVGVALHHQGFGDKASGGPLAGDEVDGCRYVFARFDLESPAGNTDSADLEVGRITGGELGDHQGADTVVVDAHFVALRGQQAHAPAVHGVQDAVKGEEIIGRKSPVRSRHLGHIFDTHYGTDSTVGSPQRGRGHYTRPEKTK